MSAAVIYTVQRLALFVVALLVLAWLGAEPVLAVVLAALISAALSYVLLRKQRDAVAAQLAERIARRAENRGVDADTAAEDALLDGRPRPDEQQPGPQDPPTRA